MKPQVRPRRQSLLVPAIAASQFAGPFMISGVAVALPALGADLNAGATALSLVETLFLAASVALLLPAGRLGDAAAVAKSRRSPLLSTGMVSADGRGLLGRGLAAVPATVFIAAASSLG